MKTMLLKKSQTIHCKVDSIERGKGRPSKYLIRREEVNIRNYLINITCSWSTVEANDPLT